MIYLFNMCLHPLHIRPKTLVRHIGAYDSLDVPCGKCYQCQDAKRSGILIRAFYEHKDSVYSFFDTLTYNDDSLPTLCGYPLFRRRDVQLFLKRLRIRIQRWLKNEKGIDCKSPFTFIVAGEYGGLKGRPHYHILFHVKCKELDVHTLKRFINETWKHGFTDSIYSTNSHVVNGLPALQYVVKYVCKDSVSRLRMDKAINAYISTLDSFSVSDSEHVKKIVHNLRRDFGCFWQCSRYYGLSLLNEIDFEDLKHRVCRYYDGNNIVHMVALPRYYVNKVYKRIIDFDSEHKILVDSVFGQDFFIDSVDKRIKDTYLRYLDAAHHVGLDPHLSWNAAIYRVVYQGRMFAELPKHPFEQVSVYSFVRSSVFTESIMQDIIRDSISNCDLRVVCDFEHREFAGLDRFVDDCELYLHRLDELKKVDNEQKDAHLQRIKHLY